MLVAVDARPLIEQKVGFGNFLFNTLSELLKIDTENDYILLSDREVFFPIEKYNNVSIKRYEDNIFCPKSFYYYLRLASFLKKNNIEPDVFWATEHLMPRGLPKRMNKILTVYDFTHIRFPESTSKFNLLLSKLFFGPSLKNSDVIVCISENTKKELSEFFPEEIRNKVIKTIYPGGVTERKKYISCENSISEEVILLAQRPYILFVGTIEPRKDIGLLIKAAPMLKDKVHVVVCGKIGWEKESVIDCLKNTDNLTYLNYVPIEEKEYLLSHCFCQVQPSIYEGFGLPVVESMQSGSITLVADNSSLHEIIEMEELRFKTGDVDEFCAKLCDLLSNYELYQKAKTYCNGRGMQFSWSKTANVYLKMFLQNNDEAE